MGQGARRWFQWMTAAGILPTKITYNSMRLTSLRQEQRGVTSGETGPARSVATSVILAPWAHLCPPLVTSLAPIAPGPVLLGSWMVLAPWEFLYIYHWRRALPHALLHRARRHQNVWRLKMRIQPVIPTADLGDEK